MVVDIGFVSLFKDSERKKSAVVNGEIIINGFKTESYKFKQDYYWMMGDNRDKSEDSRFWGFVPKSHILGQPVITWFSLNLENYLPRLSRIGNVPK